MPAHSNNGNKPTKASAKKATKSASRTVKVDTIKHTESSRTNIPTRQLQAMAAQHEEKPVTLRYPRDTSLDPQLVWKGKDESDSTDLEVTAAPIYIQEKVHPQALIEDIRERAGAGKPQPADLFSDFNGLDEAVKTDYYKHAQHWTNRMILGDSLLVMASLAEKERLRGQVQMIYLDPPYGIKFGSNWQVSTRKRDVKDGKREEVSSEREVIKAFRDTWELGVHSYLKVWRERLTVARDLLTESGSIFVQIGDENVHLVRCLLDEVLGSENFVCQITFNKTTGAGSFAGGTNVLASIGDYLLWYARDIQKVKYRQLFEEKEAGAAGASKYRTVELPDGTRRPVTEAEFKSGNITGRLMTDGGLTSQTVRTGKTTVFPVEFNGKPYLPSGGGWKTNRDGMDRLKWARRLIVGGNNLRYVRYLDDFPAYPISNIWTDIGGVQRLYENPEFRK